MIGIPHNRCGLQSFFINPQLLNYWLDWLQPALFKRKEASCQPAGELWQKNFSNVWQSQSSLPFWQRSSASLCIWQPMVAVITSSCGYWLGFHLAYRKCLSGSFHLNAVLQMRRASSSSIFSLAVWLAWQPKTKSWHFYQKNHQKTRTGYFRWYCRRSLIRFYGWKSLRWS